MRSSTTDDSGESTGGIDEYVWTFDDGTTATGETVSHTFASAGEYDIVLRVIDFDGNEATTSTTIEVEEATATALSAPD